MDLCSDGSSIAWLILFCIWIRTLVCWYDQFYFRFNFSIVGFNFNFGLVICLSDLMICILIRSSNLFFCFWIGFLRSKSIVFLLAWILRSDHLSECQHLHLHHQSTADLLHLHYSALETPYFNHRSTVSWFHLYHKDCHPLFNQLSIWIIAFYATIHLHLHPSILVILPCSFSILSFYLFIVGWERWGGWVWVIVIVRGVLIC